MIQERRKNWYNSSRIKQQAKDMFTDLFQHVNTGLIYVLNTDEIKHDCKDQSNNG